LLNLQHASSTVYLHVSKPLHLQHAYSIPFLQVATPPCRHTCNAPPHLDTSTSLQLHRASRPSYFQALTLHLQHASNTPYLYASKSIPAARVQHPIFLHPHVASFTPSFSPCAVMARLWCRGHAYLLPTYGIR
jgi:hypothetical protein